jgi:hypothetical protein
MADVNRSRRDALRAPAFVFAAALGLALCLSCAARYGENWREVSEAGFSVMMPGQPERKAEGGNAIFTLTHNDETYFVNYRLALSAPADQAEQVIDQARNGFIASTGGGTLHQERSVSVSGHPAREFTFEKFGRTGHMRIVFAKSILYFVAVTRMKDGPLSDDGRAFLDSLKIV